ncbi:hypothetical protein E2C01_039045 [Portunus trituberculatus]|uniref:Uncharacterized protein n=1 Tax=Portunus trituberculatus TaxID=210409 RepID=A0A5B7FIJ1_PORTR|nr:hypothetical protein [Portunus trituberculatus]
MEEDLGSYGVLSGILLVVIGLRLDGLEGKKGVGGSVLVAEMTLVTQLVWQRHAALGGPAAQLRIARGVVHA